MLQFSLPGSHSFLSIPYQSSWKLLLVYGFLSIRAFYNRLKGTHIKDFNIDPGPIVKEVIPSSDVGPIHGMDQATVFSDVPARLGFSRLGPLKTEA